MIDTAFISGKEDRAFVFVNGSWSLFTPMGLLPTFASEVRSAVNGSGEYRLLNKISEAGLNDAFTTEKTRADALFVTLSVLDEELSISTRVLMAEQAEVLLDSSDIRLFVEDRLLSHPLPAEVVASRHSLMHVAKNFSRVGSTLREVFDLQSRVWDIETLFNESAASVALSGEALSALVSELTDLGFFASIVRAIASTDLYKANAAIVSELLRKEHSAQARALLLDFQRRTQSLQSITGLKPKHPGNLFKKRIQIDVPSTSDTFRPDRDEPSDFKFAHTRISSLKAKERVDRQIQQIKELLFGGKLQLAERFIRELMEFQLERDEKEYAAMSLCNLSSSAVEANQVAFAEALVEYAMELSPNDIVPFTARAEIYRVQGNFVAALAMFDVVLSRFSIQSTYPLNGKANVLAEMGRFEEASSLFRQIQTDFPEHPVAFNGEVGLLHRQGNHRLALKLAVENAKRFPLDSVTRGVLASALTRNGKYADAVRHYQEAWRLDSTNLRFVSGAALGMRSSGKALDALGYLNRHLKENPQAVGLLNAKATILRGLGRFDEAREVYKSVLESFPLYAMARIGLIALNVLEESHVALDSELSPEQFHSEIDWIGFRTVMVALIKTGRAAEAARRIANALPLCPWWDQRVRLNTVLGIAEMHTDQPNCVQTFQNGLEKLDDRQKQGRLLLLSHAQIRRQNVQVGQTLARNIVTTRDSQLQRIRTQILELVPTNPEATATLFIDELEFAMAA